MTSPSLDEILAQAENPEYLRVATARILLRQDLVARHTELDAALREALAGDMSENREPVAPSIAQQLVDLEAEMIEAEAVFRFRSIGKRAWADLLAKHPPTKDQKKADPRLDNNPETFPAAAIAASSLDPALTVADVSRLEAALNSSQFDKLWLAAIDANIGGAANPKSAAAGTILRANERFGNTAAPAASPDPSSLDE